MHGGSSEQFEALIPTNGLSAFTYQLAADLKRMTSLTLQSINARKDTSCKPAAGKLDGVGPVDNRPSTD